MIPGTTMTGTMLSEGFKASPRIVNALGVIVEVARQIPSGIGVMAGKGRVISAMINPSMLGFVGKKVEVDA
jgi:hypothetical protein